MGSRIDRLPAHEIVELGITHVPEGGRLFPPVERIRKPQSRILPEKGEGEAATLKEIYRLFPILDERKNSWPTP
jgi:branched-chain amino acid transport system ATP-binding protein